MKRFYCTICKRARRVRKYPTNVSNIASEQVTDRTGTCNWHSLMPDMLKGQKTRAQFVAAVTVKGGR